MSPILIELLPCEWRFGNKRQQAEFFFSVARSTKCLVETRIKILRTCEVEEAHLDIVSAATPAVSHVLSAAETQHVDMKNIQ